jgi:hypothetical protein
MSFKEYFINLTTLNISFYIKKNLYKFNNLSRQAKVAYLFFDNISMTYAKSLLRRFLPTKLTYS